MDEVEHRTLIYRVMECMKKIRLAQLLDITMDDAKYLALVARAKYRHNNEISFIPGLNYQDFIEWVKNTPECNTFFTLIIVWNRLVSAVTMLDNRSTAAFDIMEEKLVYFKFYAHS